jgi:OOP family OmpA-OmpF porin
VAVQAKNGRQLARPRTAPCWKNGTNEPVLARQLLDPGHRRASRLRRCHQARGGGPPLRPPRRLLRRAGSCTGSCSGAARLPAAAAPAPAPKPAPAPAPAPAAPVSEKVTFAADAFFDFDKAVLKPEAKAKLDDLVDKVKGINLEVVIAVGHTDSDGSDAYNQKLSVSRAEAVKDYLTSKGVEKNRVYTEGKGEKQPVADNKTKEGKVKNRRVEIEVVGTRTKK